MSLFFNCLATIFMTASQMSNVTIVLMYTAVLVIVTSMISLKTNDPDPMLAGRNMPWWLVAGSIIGTNISSIAFLAIPAKGYIFDFRFLIGSLTGTLVSVAIALCFFVTFLRKTRNASIYTLLEDRFGRWSSIYASVAFICYSTLRMGVITFLVAQAMHVICGVDIFSVILLTGAIVIFYTYMSGIEGVIWTDLFQTIILVAAGIASIYFILQGLNLDFSELLTSVTQLPSFIDKTSELKSNWPLVAITCLFIASIETSFLGANQGIAQRYIVARSDGHAKLGLATGGIIVPFVLILFFLLGALLYVFHQSDSAFSLLSQDNTEKIFAHFIANHFPDGLKGLAIIGILAAAMSTIDTGINSSSTVLICNLYEPYSRASGYRQSLLTMQMLRTSSAAFGTAGILAAYYISLNGENVLEFFWKGLGIINSGVFGLFILLRISKKAGLKSAVSGLIVGTLVTIWLVFTNGKNYAWASPFHYMLTFPISATVTVLVGVIISKFVKEEAMSSQQATVPLSPKIQKALAKKRQSTKRNIFSDSLRPKPLYRIYATIIAAIGVVIYLEGPRIGLVPLDYDFIGLSIAVLILVIALPWIIRNNYSRPYTLCCVALLGIALPFLGAIGLFSHPNEHVFGYFYLATLLGMGLLVGWTMLSLTTMIATAVAAQVAVALYPEAGIPDNWALIAVGALSIFTYFAFDAAKENLVTERTLSRIHTIVGKIYAKVMDVSIDLVRTKRTLNFQDIDSLVKSAGDVKLMLSALLGATDINPEETHMELSVRETLDHLLPRFSKKAQQSVQIEGEDFKVLGNRDIFEGIMSHVLDNAFHYIDKEQATTVKCTLDKVKKTFTIANNGPQIKPESVPYIFDLGYTCDKESLGLGLAYCKKMLEGMRSGIRLISGANDPWIQFRLYFPKYAELPPEAQMFPIKDEADA